MAGPADIVIQSALQETRSSGVRSNAVSIGGSIVESLCAVSHSFRTDSPKQAVIEQGASAKRTASRSR